MPQEPIPSDWWDNFFESDLWARVHLKTKPPEITSKEIEFIHKVAPRGDSLHVLDMPCGIGRHATELARRGHTVTGLDHSRNLLKMAEKSAGGLKVEWCQGDMRTFRRPLAFDMVLTMWGSLGYFSDADTLQMFINIYASLKPGGVFVFDQPVLDTFLRSGFSQNHWLEKEGLYILERINWISETGRNESEWVFLEEGKVATHKSSIRIFTHHELCSLLRKAGFAKVHSFGSMELTPFTTGDRLFCVAEKAPPV